MIAMREYVTSVNGSNVRAIQALGRTALNVAERVTALNADTRRAAWQDNAVTMKALLAVKDAEELVRIEVSMAQLGFEKIISFYQNAYEILATMEQEFWKVLGAEFAKLNESTAWLEEAANSDPSGSNMAMYSAMPAASTAAEMNNAEAAQAEMAEADMTVSADATVKVVHVGLPRSKPRRTHEACETSPLELGSRARARHKRAIPGG